MAYLAQLGALTDELVAIITAISPKNERERFAACRDASLRSLRHHVFGRTNQFEVESRLDGLEEKFAVFGREPLADALQRRRESLARVSGQWKWTPEILHFLLELSDNPVEKSDLVDLELLHPPAEVPGAPLRWDDIAEEDGWARDRALWRTINYADTSDEDELEEVSSAASSDGEDTTLSSVEAGQLRTAKDLVIQSDAAALLDAVKQSQAWRYASTPKDSATGWPLRIPLSELQLVREVLFMLQGLETSLFDATCAPVPVYQLSDISWDTHKALVTSIARCGRRLLPLRERLGKRQDVPLLQVFQESIRHSLQSFDREVAAIQARLIDIKRDVVVSVVAVMEELRPSLASLFALSSVVQQLEDEPHAHAFRYLELLFDAACTAQLGGDEAVFRFLGTIFFDCFQVYLRPIRLWMEEGRLLAGDRIFFVSESPTTVPRNQIWQDQFKVLRTGNGVLHAPKFLQPAASRIFTTGKSIVVLKLLGRYDYYGGGGGPADEPALSLETACPPGTELAPFAELFSSAFDRWIQSKHHAASATLRETLFSACGLWSSLDALQAVYLMTDGALADAFAGGVFRNLDTLNPRWHDRFTLTEMAQEAFAPRLDAYCLSASVDDDLQQGNDPVAARSSLRNGLPRIRLHYRLAWPVQLIVPRESMAAYQSLFTLLLQIRRANSLLCSHRLLDDDVAEGWKGRRRRGGDSGSNSTRITQHEREQALYYTLRARLLWFCGTLYAYLTGLVLAPAADRMRADLREADDVDAMISVHARFLSSVADEACLGSRLAPIRDCLLDLLDLALALEDARRANAAREADEMREISRLSLLTSPFASPSKGGRRASVSASQSRSRHRASHHHRGPSSSDDEKSGDEDAGDTTTTMGMFRGRRSYVDVLRAIAADCSRYLRFVSGGLRGVARASGDAAAAAKWDMLAEMLETGMREQQQQQYQPGREWEL